jgi:Trypsin
MDLGWAEQDQHKRTLTFACLKDRASACLFFLHQSSSLSFFVLFIITIIVSHHITSHNIAIQPIHLAYRHMYIISTIMKFTIITLAAWVGSVYAIQNGTDVKDSTLYPYFVTIGNPHVCGGVFLSLEPEAWVLTAAHCVYDATLPPPSPNPYFASFGDVFRQDQHIEAITDWIVHPDYVTSSGDTDMRYDLALVKLKRPVKESSTVSRVAIYQDNMAIDVNTMGRSID